MRKNKLNLSGALGRMNWRGSTNSKRCSGVRGGISGAKTKIQNPDDKKLIKSSRLRSRFRFTEAATRKARR